MGGFLLFKVSTRATRAPQKPTRARLAPPTPATAPQGRTRSPQDRKTPPPKLYPHTPTPRNAMPAFLARSHPTADPAGVAPGFGGPWPAESLAIQPALPLRVPLPAERQERSPDSPCHSPSSEPPTGRSGFAKRAPLAHSTLKIQGATPKLPTPYLQGVIAKLLISFIFFSIATLLLCYLNI